MNIFQESKGIYSMRRVCAFIMFIAGIIAIPVCIIYKVGDWKLSLAYIGLPFLVGTLLLFFTTWSDIKGVVESIKN